MRGELRTGVARGKSASAVSAVFTQARAALFSGSAESPFVHQGRTAARELMRLFTQFRTSRSCSLMERKKEYAPNVICLCLPLLQSCGRQTTIARSASRL